MTEPLNARRIASTSDGTQVELFIKPEPLRVKLNETAIVVVEMQNAHAMEGDYADIAGFSVEGARGAVAQTKPFVKLHA